MINWTETKQKLWIGYKIALDINTLLIGQYWKGFKKFASINTNYYYILLIYILMTNSPPLSPRLQPGDTFDGIHPYANGLALGASDKTGVVGDESQVDNVQKFEPLPQEVKVGPQSSLMLMLILLICCN